MDPFRFSIHTPLYFGADCMKKNAALFKNFGNKAFIITSKFLPGCTNYALQDAEEILKDLGIEYKINIDVIENPPVSSVVEITDDVKAFNPDFLVAIGGGSAIDTAKAVSVMLKYPGKDPIEVFYGAGLPFDKMSSEGSLPLIVVPTTAGTGADVTGFSVLTREDTHTKMAIGQKVFSDIAFLDAKYIKESPSWLMHSGALDALSHGVETYVNTASNFLNRSIAEIAFKLFAGFKDAMLENKYTDEQLEKMVLASTIQGIAFMQAGTCLPHGMSYPLSHFKDMPHGLACGVLLGNYLKAFKDQSIVLPIVKMCGFETVDEFAEYLKQIVAQDFNVEVTEEEIMKWSTEFCSLEYRLVRHPEPIALEEIAQIYRNSLRK